VVEEPVIVEPAPEIPKAMYTTDELFCLAAIIYNEAGGDACTDEHRALVGYVVLNRVNDPRFANSIRRVLETPGQYVGMQDGVKFSERYTAPGEKHAVERAYKVAQEVLENRNNIPIPETVVFQAEFVQGAGIYKQMGNTYFCYAKEVN
jgi:spore germination cell wall hydrolase CwlJ-like protein